MQQWLVPSPDPDTAAHALLFRPPGDGPFRLAVIAHASTQNALRRAQMPQPEYRALAAWLVARGFAVLVPERPGHGATGGRYLEDQGGCDEADYIRAGRATAGSIAAALGYLRRQSFILQDGAVVLGHSAGALGRAGAGRRKSAGGGGHHCIRAGPRRPRQRFSQSGLRAAYADVVGGRIRQGRARAGDMAGGGQRHAISRPICRGSSPMRSAPAATKSTFMCWRHPAARAIGWRKPRPASEIAGPELERALKRLGAETGQEAMSTAIRYDFL